MISRNPKYIEPIGGDPIESAKKTWFFALIVPTVVLFLALAAYRAQKFKVDWPLNPLQEQYVLFASGIVLLGVAYLANLVSRKGLAPWPWVVLGIASVLPTGAAHLLRVEFARLSMVAGSTVLIWIAVVVPAFHRSKSTSIRRDGDVQGASGD